MIMKGTRAIQMFLGLMLLFVLYWTGLTFNLYSLNWLLEHFFNYFIIIIIILFQDQVREALANLGLGRSFYQKSLIESEHNIEEIIEALKVFQEEGIGALIVIERNNGLLNYIKSGTEIYSKINFDLFYSIFFPKSPLHDGAVIISQNKIASAGSFLPLSKKVDIDRKLGTRHRAALGITEVSDAVALVVSEERKEIKVFVGGEEKVCESLSMLRGMLRELYTKERSDFYHTQKKGQEN